MGPEFVVMAPLILIGLAARWLTYRKPSRPRQSDAPVVTIAVGGPVLKVPSLTDAYSALRRIAGTCWADDRTGHHGTTGGGIFCCLRARTEPREKPHLHHRNRFGKQCVLATH